MIFSTQVDAHWLKKSDRFWYTYETTEGKKWYIVDPLKAEKKLLFDNDKLAAAITRIVKDPFDSKHLGLDSLKFIKDENWIQFEVKSTQDVEKKDSVRKKPGAGKENPLAPEKKIYYFEYNLLDGDPE
jgi:dipeptidyl-peptidase-4